MSNDYNVNCPFCLGPLASREEAVRVGNCNVCNTPHHETCWSDNGSSCAVHLCQGNTLVNLRIPITREQRIEQARQELETAIASHDDQEILRVWARHQELLRDDASQHLRMAVQLAKLRTVISSGDDAQILKIWEDSTAPLDSYPPAQEHRLRVEQARERLKALEALRRCQTDEELVQVWQRHEKLLRGYSSADVFRERAVQIQQHLVISELRAAIAKADDEKIAAIYQEHEQLLTETLVLSNEQQTRVLLAQQRFSALQQLREALKSGNVAQIVDIYSEHERLLYPCRNFRKNERQAVTQIVLNYWPERLREAIEEGDEKAIALVGQRAIDAGCALEEVEYDAIYRAQYMMRVLERLTEAIANDDDVAIVQRYMPSVLDQAKSVTPDQRERVELARKRVERWYPLRKAFERNDDFDIARLYDEALFADSPLLQPEQRERCELAVRRQVAFEKLQVALESNLDDRIVEAYDDTLLDRSSLLSQSQKRRVEQAKKQVSGVQAFTEALENGGVLEIGRAYQSSLKAGIRLPDEINWKTVFDAWRQVEALDKLRQALRTNRGDDETIARLAQPLLNSARELLKPDERRQVRNAVQRVGAWQRLRQALASGDDREIAKVYQPELLQSYPAFTQEERQNVASALSRLPGLSGS